MKANCLHAAVVRTDAGIGPKRQLHPGFQRLAEVLPVKLSQFRVVLQKILGNFSQPARLLNALFIVNIHVQVSAMLLGQRDAFVVDHGRVLDRSHACPDRILDALGRVRMRLDAQSEVAGFIHRGLQFFRSEFLRFRIAAMRQHGAAGEDLDVVGAVVHQLADSLPHFPGTVCLP